MDCPRKYNESMPVPPPTPRVCDGFETYKNESVVQEWSDPEGGKNSNEVPPGDHVSEPKSNLNGNYKVTVTEKCETTCLGYHIDEWGAHIGACTNGTVIGAESGTCKGVLNYPNVLVVTV